MTDPIPNIEAPVDGLADVALSDSEPPAQNGPLRPTNIIEQPVVTDIQPAAQQDAPPSPRTQNSVFVAAELTSQQKMRQLMQQIRSKHSELRDTELRQAAQKRRISPLPPLDIQLTTTLRGHQSAVYTCAWSPNSQFIASGGMDSSVIIWNPLKAQKIKEVPAATFTTTVRWSPNSDQLVFGGLDCQLMLWNGSKTHPLNKQEAYISSACFYDQTHTVSTSGDGQAVVYDIQREEVINQFNHLLDALSVDSVGGEILTGAADGFTRLWDIRSNSQTQIFQHKNDAHCVRFHPSRQQIGVVTSNNKLLIFDRRTEHLLIEIGPETQKSYLKQQQELRSLSFSKGGRIAFAAGEQAVYAFDILQGAFLGVAGQHETQIGAVDVSPDGWAVASAGWDTLVKVWG